MNIMLKAILRKSGTSLVVTIPPAIADMMNATEGTEFELEFVSKNKLMLSKGELNGMQAISV